MFNKAKSHAIGTQNALNHEDQTIQLISEKLYWRDRLRLWKGYPVDRQRMARRFIDGDIADEIVQSCEDLEDRVRHSQAKWNEYVKDKKETYF